jgi:uncharacterized protein
MSERSDGVTITVRGEHEERIAPEEAVAHLTVRAEGPERGPVVEALSARSAPVGEDLARREADGSVVRWSSQRVAVWSERPWSDGRRLAPVHHASVEFAATFTDVPTLSWWLGEVAEHDGVEIGAIEWRLTPATATRVEAAVAARAVEAAVERASAYAAAIGLAEVVPVEIADAGLLAHAEPAASAPRLMRAAMSTGMDAAGPAVDLRPDDIVVSATVEARFTAR